MAFTFGFYNALNHDRRYNAIQVSSIFDGIVRDGVFMSIGGHMNVQATGNGFNIVVESGRAWFNHTWSLLDADYPMVVEPSDVLEDRIDAVVLEVNENVDVRLNSIKIIKGEPAASPKKPTLTNNLDVHQYPLAYITVPANSVTLTQSNVENAVGTSATPFVTGILETIDIDDLIAQWKSQWNDWTEEVDLNWNNWFETVNNAWTAWFNQSQSDWEDTLQERTEEWEEIKDTIDSEWASQQGSINSDYTNWKQTALAAYNQWLEQIQGTLDDDAATQLASEIVELKNRDDVISTYQHVKNGTEHLFIGSGSNGKVKMRADVASGDTVVISSAPKNKITVQGETSQPGTGDPSPNNIRMIDGVGMYDQCIVLDGSEDENWQRFEGSPGAFYIDFTLQYGLSEDNASGIKVNRLKYKNSSLAIMSNDAFYFQSTSISSDVLRFVIRVDDSSTNPQVVRDALSKHPLIVWYRSVDFYKSKGPFYYVHEVSDGTTSPYKAIGIELNAPLFDGDSLEIGGLSGLDQMMVLDGTENWLRDPNGTYRVVLVGAQLAAVGSDKIQYSSSKYLWSPKHQNVSNKFNVVEGSATLYVVDKDADDLPAFKQQLSDWASAGTPLTIFYRSVNYTPENDIAVALEKRENGYIRYDGTEDITTDSNGQMVLFALPSPGSSRAYDDPESIICSHYPYKNVSSDNTLDAGVKLALGIDAVIIRDSANFETDEELSSFLSSQQDLGTPVQVVYELASSATYAHPIQPETLPAYYGTEGFVMALAGEPVTGKWLSFTNDGTQLNFKGGGGIGVSKLAATTAVPADVVQGRTFYSKDKTLKTGTLADKPALNDAVSVGNDGSNFYVRILVGAYRTKQATGYPEIRFPNSDAIENIPGGDNGAWNGTYSGSNVTIPKGYHNGNGSVGVAGGNRGNWNGTYSGSDVTIPQGYHNGSGSVGVAGGNRGAWGSTINPGGSVTIPQGWHNGGGVVKANGNSIKFHPIDRTVGWGSGVLFTGEDATPGASGKMRFVLKYWCRTEYNVNGYIKVLRNGSEIHSTTFNKNYDSPYNDDVPNGYINVEFSGSGTYQIQVSVDYNAGNGEIKMGGAFIGY